MAESEWDAWVNGYIINHYEKDDECVFAICRRGAIVGLDGLVWGQVNFQFETYQFDQLDDDGNVCNSFTVDEWTNFNTCWESQGKKMLPGGIRMNNEKFLLAKFDEDREVMYLTGQNMGACIAKAGSCFCIGVYYKTGEPLQTSLGNTRNYSAGNANGAVENCRTKCVDQGL